MAVSDRPDGGDTDDVVRTRLNPAEPAAVALPKVVAAARDVAPSQVEDPVYEQIDPDALDALRRHAREVEDASWTVTCLVDGVEVTVDSDGSVVARDRRED